MIAWLRRWWSGPDDEGGLGQSPITDALWIARFRRLRRLPVVWARPTLEEARWWQDHPLLGRCADDCYALAEIDGRRAAVMDRIWSGWPDPPEFVLFVLDADDSAWAARDFDNWPRAWVRPGGL